MCQKATPSSIPCYSSDWLGINSIVSLILVPPLLFHNFLHSPGTPTEKKDIKHHEPSCYFVPSPDSNLVLWNLNPLNPQNANWSRMAPSSRNDSGHLCLLLHHYQLVSDLSDNDKESETVGSVQVPYDLHFGLWDRLLHSWHCPGASKWVASAL